MMHKTDAGLRPFYLTHEFTIHDAPNEDEIVVELEALQLDELMQERVIDIKT